MRKGGWMARLRSGTSCRREQKHSQWEFPDWIPVAHKWTCLSDRYHGSREGAGTKKNGAGPSSVWSEPEMGEAVLPHPSVYLLWAFGSLGFCCGATWAAAGLCGGWHGAGAGLGWLGEGGEISSHLCLHSEAAPYLPAEERSPLFSIQREGIKDDGALYRLNRCVMGCPQAQQVFAACQAVPLLAWQWLSGCPQACLGYPEGCIPGLGIQPVLCPGVPPAPAPALQKPSPLSHAQVQLSAAPPRAPGCLLLRGRPGVGDGVVPNPRGLCSPAVRGRGLPQEHGGDSQRVWASLRPCTPAALGPGRAAHRAGVSAWGLPRSCVPPWDTCPLPQPEPQELCWWPALLVVCTGVYWSCWAPAAVLLMPTALPTKPGWPMPSLLTMAVCGT